MNKKLLILALPLLLCGCSNTYTNNVSYVFDYSYSVYTGNTSRTSGHIKTISFLKDGTGNGTYETHQSGEPFINWQFIYTRSGNTVNFTSCYGDKITGTFSKKDGVKCFEIKRANDVCYYVQMT